jgi:sporulation protein YlmC with PRC-barrel domain
MIIASQNLIGLPVLTQSETHLGRVSGFEMDAETGKIINFFVSTGLIKGLLNQQLSIAFDQVISLDDKKMIVKDTLKKIPILDLEGAKLATE